MKKLLFTLGIVAIASYAYSQTTLSFNPANGAKYEFDYNTKQDMKGTFFGQEVPMNQILNFSYEMQVTGKTSSEVKVTFKYKTFRYKLSAMLMSLDYDSKNPSAAVNQADAALAKFFAKVLDKPFYGVIATDGTIKSLTGMDVIVSEATKAMGNDVQATMLSSVLKPQLSNEAVRVMFEQSTKLYPGKAVSTGESWNIQQTFKLSGHSLVMNSTYTLKSVSASTATVGLSSQVTGKLNGTQSGQLEFDLATGLLLKSDATQSLKGVINMNGVDMNATVGSRILITISKL